MRDIPAIAAANATQFRIGSGAGPYNHAVDMSEVRRAALMLGVLLLAASLSSAARAQIAKAAFQDNYADVNGMRLHYASVGSGPLILFLHGYPSFWYQWKDQMAEMGRDHLAVGLDMRGYNLSSRPDGLEPYTMPHLVEDVRQVAEKVGGKDRRFILVAARLHHRRPQLLPRQSSQSAVQRSASGIDDPALLVGEGRDRRSEVHDHPDTDAGDLGDEGHGNPVQSSERPGQMGDEPQRPAVSGR
jgi:alpha/beta hydrolase family protein